jgi:hypothetical protein
MQPGVFLTILGFWVLVIVAVGVYMVSRIRREGRTAREARPQYDFGNTVPDWERACQQSYDWSHSRRNGHKTEKGVKS